MYVMRIGLVSMLTALMYSSLNPAFGGLVIFVNTNYSWSPGTQNATMEVRAYAASDDLPDPGAFLNSYSLAFDFGSPGMGFPASFSGFQAKNFGAFVGNSTPNANPNRDNYDFSISASLPEANFDTVDLYGKTSAANSLKLFDLEFDIDPAAAPGSYVFSLVTNATNFSGLIQVNGKTGSFDVVSLPFVADGGSFNVTGEAVPEPGVVSLVGIGLVGLAARRFRKRKVLVGQDVV